MTAKKNVWGTITKIEQCKTGMKVVANLKSNPGVRVDGVLHVENGKVWVCHNSPHAVGSGSPNGHGMKYSWLVMNEGFHTLPNNTCEGMTGENVKPFVPVESKPVVKVYEWEGIEYTKDTIGGLSVDLLRKSIVHGNDSLKKWNQLFGDKKS